MQPPLPVIPSGRPKVLTAAAIISFVIGGFYCFGIVGALLSLRNTQFGAMPGMDDAMLQAMQELNNEPHLKALQLWGGLVGAAVGVLLIAAGFGLLKCLNWARMAVIFSSLYILAASVAGTYITFVYTLPMTEKVMAIAMRAQSAGKGDEAAASIASKFTTIFAAAGAVGGLGLALAIAITLIVLVTRPQAKAACHRAA